MKNFRLEVHEGNTNCGDCPFMCCPKCIQISTKEDICDYLVENQLCTKYDFTTMHIWDDLNN